MVFCFLKNSTQSHSILSFRRYSFMSTLHFEDVIQKAIEDARIVIVLWSVRSVESTFVKDEAMPCRFMT